MKKLAVLALMAFAVSAAVAEEPRQGGERESRIWLPIGLSILTPPVQLPSPSHSVFGAMLNLGYGQLDNLAILDVGVVNNVTECMTGFEVGAVNLSGTCIGAQVGAVNIASKTIGIQLGVLNMTGDLHGLQLGLLNFSDSGGALVFPIFNLGF